ncbi:MAG TPA: hypothetical protein VNT42_12350 [Sphingomonas sp.]|nr:hypothetical protein [Sphingomonas sp.]
MTGAHLRILAEQAEDRLERARAAEELARRNARVKGSSAPTGQSDPPDQPDR